ncbi:hypothetical protein ABZ883_12905 [Streptomyces sp. NPDC046977]|uniref:hypothetical protein n=1 Tax=Streptomyces sp. NPDC046977 TaxID=3154703 RepID=UPI00340CC508
MCTVEYGLSDYIVHAELPDGSSLIISPPQEPPTDHPPGHPKSWLVTRGHPDDSAVHEVIYDSEPDGPHAQHGGSLPSLLVAIDARLDQLGILSADPHSVPGMTDGLTETATPHEATGITEELSAALLRALPQLTELVAAAATWIQARLAFENPHNNPTFETRTRLATATRLLRDVQEQLEVAENTIAACPGEPSDPKCHDKVPFPRAGDLSGALASDAITDTKPPAAPSPEAERQRAARGTSPHAAIQRTTPSRDRDAPTTDQRPATPIPRTR